MPGKQHLRGVSVKEQREYEHIKESAERSGPVSYTHLDVYKRQAMAWASDPDGLRIHFNRSWLAFTGRTLEQELGEGWVDGIHPDDRQRCRDICRSSVTSRQPFKMEYRLRRADGQFRWVLSHGEPRFSDRGVFELSLIHI